MKPVQIHRNGMKRAFLPFFLAPLLAATAACSASEESSGSNVAGQRDLALGQHPGTPTKHGVPTTIDPGADLGRQADGTGASFGDSIYITGRLTAGNEAFGYLLHVLRLPGGGRVVESVSITDESGKRYLQNQEVLALDGLAWSPGGLDLHTSSVSWTGDDEAQHIAITFPLGALDLELEVQGPVLYYGGVGEWPLLGNDQWQYALPRILTSGTLTLEGTTHEVVGESWLDRQWGDLPDLSKARWTWFNIALPEGDTLGIWDLVAGDEAPDVEDSWATVLHPDGTHELLPVTPLAENAGGNWTSPVTGKSYPTRWLVSIPTRDTEFTVVADVLEQELPALGVYEGLATVTGTYRGEPVETQTYVEQAGSWTQR